MYFAQTPHTGPVPSAEALKVLDGYFAWRRTPEGEGSVIVEDDINRGYIVARDRDELYEAYWQWRLKADRVFIAVLPDKRGVPGYGCTY